MMKFAETGDPDVLNIKNQTHGCLIIFGLPFLLAGLVLIGTSLGVVPIKSHPSAYFEVPFGLLLAAVGVVLIFGRYGIIIDRRHKIITRWSGLPMPIRKIKTFFDNFNRVVLIKDNSKNDAASYGITLEGDNVSTLDLNRFVEYQEARQFAEDIAKFISLPLADRSSGKEIVRDWDKLDESVRDRARRMGEKLDVGTAPMNMRSRVMEQIGSVTIEIPPKVLTPILYFKVIVPLIFVSLLTRIFIYPMLTLMMPADLRKVLPIAISAVIVILTALISYRKAANKAYKTCIVTASKESLIIEEKSVDASKVTEMPASEIEELELPDFALPPGIFKTPDGKFSIDPNKPIQTPNAGNYQPGPNMLAFLSTVARLIPQKGITARSNKQTIEFAQGLDEDEMKYVYALIKKAMIG